MLFFEQEREHICVMRLFSTSQQLQMNHSTFPKVFQIKFVKQKICLKSCPVVMIIIFYRCWNIREPGWSGLFSPWEGLTHQEGQHPMGGISHRSRGRVWGLTTIPTVLPAAAWAGDRTVGNAVKLSEPGKTGIIKESILSFDYVSHHLNLLLTGIQLNNFF